MKIEISDNKKWQQSLTIKMILLGFMGLMLLAPLEIIKSIISERQKNSENVKKEIALQWAGKQIVSGPVLNIPLRTWPDKKDSDPYKSVLHIMPESLLIDGEVQTETRYRGIYQAVVYNADISISGEFKIPELNFAEKSQILWNEAYYTLGISDNRGLKGEIVLLIDSARVEAVPGVKDSEVFNSGITFPINFQEQVKSQMFNLKFKISGSEGLSFSPVGKTSRVSIKSPWKSPGFTGNFLPSSRLINDNGFNAEWIVTNLNRNFPQSWTGSSYKPEKEDFGVDFVLQIDHYQKSLRSAKYGILFIALTFLALLFVEMSVKEKIHIFHYLLVSLGLVLFFSLLNALSEHTGFNLAYLISSVATITLITSFMSGLTIKRRPVILIALLLGLLYSFIFILLTLNDYAYLAGNIGLFILLAVTMKLSLKLNMFGKDTD